MNHSGTLYVVATPIGNLQDITLRALEILKIADVVAAEDTRHTAQLLGHFGIQAKLVALHEHNELKAGGKLVEAMQSGGTVALVSDAGTPGISDPGALLVRMARAAGIRVVPVPGPSAVVTALSVAGFAAPHFLFYGFLPARSGHRWRELEALRALPHTLVFYEAPHRILECVADLEAVLGGQREITFARELTKTFETIHACRLDEATAWLVADSNRQRGEFVLLVQGAPLSGADALDPQIENMLRILLGELPLKQAVKLAAAISGTKKNTLYELALRWQAQGD